MNLEEMLANIVMEISFLTLENICKENNLSLEKLLDELYKKGYFDR